MGRRYDRKKIVWGSWATVCKNRDNAGLGIKDIQCFSAALLGKWKWTLGVDEKGLWKDIIVSKNGSWRSLDKEGNNNTESRWWKDLRNMCKGKRDCRDWFNQNYT